MRLRWILAIGILTAQARSLSHAQEQLKILPPSEGAYFGAYADFGATEDKVTTERIARFERLAGRKIAWAYFSNHWLDGRIQFPAAAVTACKRRGVIPYIRLSPWSVMEHRQADPLFSMQALLDKRFDADLRVWARSARDAGTPMMIEFGPEVNGDWFPWNGRWNGGGTGDQYGDPLIPDGPERFRDAFRHLIELFREEGVRNVTWVLHVDASPTPAVEWNDFRHYYPGDQYIDWIGLSVFGAQLPEDEWRIFPAKLKRFLPQISAVTTKPILVAEFATIEDWGDLQRKSRWLKQAFQSVSKGLFPQIKGLSYWHSPGWLPKGEADLRIDSSAQSLKTFRSEAADPFWKSDVEVSRETPPDRHETALID